MEDRRITEDILKEIGFVDTGEEHGYNKIWRYKPEGYYHHFQFVMGDYPKGNGNVGVLGLYNPECEVSSVPDDLVDKEEWTEEDQIRAENYTITEKESLLNIAWHLTSEVRLRVIIESLTTKF